MSFLEICGVIFIAVLIINGLVGIISLRTAVKIQEDPGLTRHSHLDQ